MANLRDSLTKKHIGYELPNAQAFIFKKSETGWEEKGLTVVSRK